MFNKINDISSNNNRKRLLSSTFIDTIDYRLIFPLKHKTSLLYFKECKIDSSNIFLIFLYQNNIHFKLNSIYENIYSISTLNKMIFKSKNEDKTIEDIISSINFAITNKNIKIQKETEMTKLILNLQEGEVIFELKKKLLNQQIKDHCIKISNKYITDTFINPNFKNQNCLIKNSSSLFDIYNPFNNSRNDIIIIFQNNINLNISFYSLIFKECLKNIDSIKSKLTEIKHFFNPKDSFDYLCVADTTKTITVFNLTNNFSLLYQIKTYYTFNIFNCLMIFDEKNNNSYLISPTYAINGDNYTKIYILEDGSYIKKFPSTNKNSTIFLLSWFHKKLNHYYIIELCSEKIFIYNLITNGFYAEFKEKEVNDYLRGCIVEDYYLYTLAFNYNLYVYDLYKKVFCRKISFENINNKNLNNKIYDAIVWSKNYLILSYTDDKSLKILDIRQDKIISVLKLNINKSPMLIKKILNPIFGESLVVSCNTGEICLITL